MRAGLTRDLGRNSSDCKGFSAAGTRKRELERKTALLAVDLAEKLVATRLSDMDQRNLVERFVTQVETQSTHTATGGRL